MKIYVTRPIPQVGLDILRRVYPDYKMNQEDRVLQRHELLAAVKGLDGLLNFKFENLKLENYQSWGKIAAPVAV